MKYVLTITAELDTEQRGAYSETTIRNCVTRALNVVAPSLSPEMPAGFALSRFAVSTASVLEESESRR